MCTEQDEDDFVCGAGEALTCYIIAHSIHGDPENTEPCYKLHAESFLLFLSFLFPPPPLKEALFQI